MGFTFSGLSAEVSISGGISVFGDLVNSITGNVANGSSIEFQPDEGVEVQICSAGSSSVVYQIFMKSSNYDILIDSCDANANNYGNKNLPVINHTHWLKIKNNSGSTQALGFTGYELP